MVEAVAMRTTGLGGDSEVGFISDGLLGGVKLGPKRVIPISLLAHEAPDVVLPALKKQLQASTPGEYDCLFVRKVDGIDTAGLSLRDQTVFERISNKIYPLGQVLETRVEALSIQRLVSRGLVEVSGVTPSDACHVLDLLDTWDREAANIALEIFGRRRTGAGNTLAQTGYDMAHIIINQLTAQTSQALLEAAFKEEIEPYLGLPEDLAKNELVQRGLARSDGLVKIETSLNIDVIGLGASATTYYPAVGNKLHCIVNLPQHAGVANAIGAVVGRVTMRQSGTITAPSEGIFRVHFVDGPEDFSVEDEALTALEERLGKIATAEAKAGGTENVQLVARRDIKRANAESRDIFIEATVSVEASGRPRTSLS